MDKKTATLTLTDKLRRLNAPQVVINSVYQKKLVDNALACYQVGDIVAVGSYGIRDTLKNKNSNLHEKLEPKANYLFVENIDLDKRVVVSSFAIISEEEVEQLKNTFYNDVPSDVEAAMNTLNIKNYTEIYNKYSSGELNKIIAGYNFYLKFKKSLDELFFTRNSSCTPESFEKYLGKSRSEIIDGLKDVGFEDKPYGWSDIAVPKSTIKGIVKTLETAKYFNLLPGFFNLVFTMPRE
ncbi:hypothetical protein FJZ53_02590, partial [Candidatus Woesearchaeota archaeon]|nr:hypothetical protein [Candidatus Woesearchaeota archaeon]